MTERPILFTPGNCEAILDGSKTQTRRIIRLPAAPNHLGAWEPTICGGPDGGRTKDGRLLPEMRGIWLTRTGASICCPWSVGDRLWVREGLCKSPGGLVQYRRDLKVVGWAEWEWQRNTLSPIHMPHRFARLWLEITEVRVQRLQEIGEGDAIAEGVSPCGHTTFHVDEHTCSYRALWESIHGHGSWDANPWVWAISFKRRMA